MKQLFVTLIAVGLFLLTECSVLDSGPKPGLVTEAKVIWGTWELIYRDGGYVQYNGMELISFRPCGKIFLITPQLSVNIGSRRDNILRRTPRLLFMAAESA